MDFLSDLRLKAARERAWRVGNPVWMRQWLLDQARRSSSTALEFKSEYAARCLKIAQLGNEVEGKANFNPSQPRVPAGNSDGGRWTSDASNIGADETRVISDAEPDNFWIPGTQLAANDPPPLQRVHPDSTYESDQTAKGSLNFWKQKSTNEMVESLKPGAKDPLTVKSDGTVMDGNTRVKILQERGFNVNSLPRELHTSPSIGRLRGGGGGFGSGGGGKFPSGGGLPRLLPPWL